MYLGWESKGSEFRVGKKWQKESGSSGKERREEGRGIRQGGK